MPHVERRGNGRYRARYREPDGKERSRSFNRRTDADRFLTGIEHSKLTGGYVDPAAGRITFRSFAEGWRSTQVHRPGTATSVETQLRLHVYPIIGHRPIAAIRPTELQGLVHRLAESLATSTVSVVYGRVVAVFRAAVRDRVITTSPCVGIRLPRRAPASLLEVLTTDQVHALAETIDARYTALVLTAAGTGLRPGELFGLRLDRVDFLRRSLRVDTQIARLPCGGVGLAPLKTPSSYRTVPLPSIVTEALSTHLARWPAETETGVVFTTARGGFVQQHPFAAVWETAKRRTGSPSWATPHDLRHYYASVLIRSGASVKVIQSRLGHASAKTTLDVYGHLFPDEEDRTRYAIEAELRPPAASRRPAELGIPRSTRSEP